ncbi:MAG: serine/threonine protein kinase [Lachnospiraceae bacterium]|nr:serine/threonine protein kinase [Lachnospiraceae bacterium]
MPILCSGRSDNGWRIEKPLHQGVMSRVWLLQSPKVEWRLVLKAATDHEKSVWALGREMTLLRQLRGEGIPFLYHQGEEEGIPWYTMPFYEGETLRGRLDRLGTLPEEETAQIGRRLCRILDVLHHRRPPVIYGDLKPENVILTGDGGVVLLDYGNAWLLGEKQDSIRFRGTPGYAAPECWHLEKATTAVDLFALGVLLHEMLEGGKPQEHFGQYRLENTAYKKRWQTLINDCTAFNTENRIQDVRQADRRLAVIPVDRRRDQSRLCYAVSAMW